MPTKAAVPVEKMYECEVKRRRVRLSGGYESFWKMKLISDAVIDGDLDFRCQRCHHEMKLHKRDNAQGGSHVTHRLKADGDRCTAVNQKQTAAATPDSGFAGAA
jgi:hypothetical protein